jgi:zinc D-Ala-D-Ala carboxypeptidase
MRFGRTSLSLAFVVAASVVVQSLMSPAAAYDWKRALRRGKKGADVRALQVRVAGYFPSWRQRRFHIDGSYGDQTATAVKKFEKRFGFKNPNGAAGRRTLRKLNGLTDRDGSTAHFDWSEFKQHSNSGCSAQANAYAGTFKGGKVSTKRVKRNVRRLMWRLEAVRRKSGRNPMGINSGFRSVSYNSCIGGSSLSQHMYGTAADNRIAAISNSRARHVAKGSQVSGIACYSNTTHNHFDIRIENRALSYAQSWWWPRRDSSGRELDESGRPCWGEGSSTATASMEAVRTATPGAGSLIPSVAEVQAFEEAGEPSDLGGAD